MSLPATRYDLPFNITRASHATLFVADVDRSLRFYTEAFGLVVTERERSTVWLRGMEESCHHSLVLHTTDGPSTAGRIGFRAFRDADLEQLADHALALGLAPRWAEIPHQGRTLQLEDPGGTPLEFCARMPVQPRLLTDYDRYRGGGAMRLDHFQLHVPDVRSLTAFYTGLGFRISEYVSRDGEEISAAFLQRKGNPHDIVLFAGPGPRLHHVAYTVSDPQRLLFACDVAGQLGYGARVERGPGRHGPGHALYVYMRDPDGHRAELFTTHYQTLDIDDEPVRWDPREPAFGMPWGLPAQRSWHLEASPFAGVAVGEPLTEGGPPVLEDYLAGRA
jgi:3,4-dihydroxyphenylacetate 2,3-dioxygenase